MVDEIKIMPSGSLLLPNNKTPLEIALADLSPRLSLFDLADAIKGYRTNISDNVAPWLASEWNLGGFIDYFDGDAQKLIEEGVEWLQKRGTAEAVEIALSWIGFDKDKIKIESDKGKIHIDIGTAENVVEQLADIKFLVKESLPASADLYRIYHKYDRRVLVADKGSFNNELLSDDSGVWIDGVKISLQGEYQKFINLDAELAVIAVLSRLHSIYIQRKKGIYYDFCAWGDKIPLDGSFVISISHLINTNLGGVFSKEQYSNWKKFQEISWKNVNSTWKDGGVIDNTEPHGFPTRFVAKSSLAGGYSKYEELNCYWGGGVVKKYHGKTILDGFKWGEKTEYFEYLRFYEISQAKHYTIANFDILNSKTAKGQNAKQLNNVIHIQNNKNVRFSQDFYFDKPNNNGYISNHFANNNYYVLRLNEAYSSFRNIKSSISTSFGKYFLVDSKRRRQSCYLHNQNSIYYQNINEITTSDGGFLIDANISLPIINFDINGDIYCSRDKQTWQSDKQAKWDNNLWRGRIVFKHSVL